MNLLKLIGQQSSNMTHVWWMYSHYSQANHLRVISRLGDFNLPIQTFNGINEIKCRISFMVLSWAFSSFLWKVVVEHQKHAYKTKNCSTTSNVSPELFPLHSFQPSKCTVYTRIFKNSDKSGIISSCPCVWQRDWYNISKRCCGHCGDFGPEERTRTNGYYFQTYWLRQSDVFLNRGGLAISG